MKPAVLFAWPVSLFFFFVFLHHNAHLSVFSPLLGYSLPGVVSGVTIPFTAIYRVNQHNFYGTSTPREKIFPSFETTGNRILAFNLYKMPRKLVFLRHGESTWNKENRFTGWTDVPLSSTGKAEAEFAGKSLKDNGYRFDVLYTSVLKRAIQTSWTVLNELEQHYVPVVNSWRLNERHYGALQGLNKAETAEKHGEQQVKLWRRSYDIPPPPLGRDDERWSGKQEAYKFIPKDCCPLSESLKDTIARVLPFWFDHISPSIAAGKNVLICAHGNSLRGLIKHLDGLTDAEVIDLNIPTGAPLVYELDDDLKPIKHYYLLNEEELKRRIELATNPTPVTKA